jgi:hypothetical protein
LRLANRLELYGRLVELLVADRRACGTSAGFQRITPSQALALVARETLIHQVAASPSQS